MNNASTKTYAFVLGREIEIAKSELESVLSYFCFSFSSYSVSNNIAYVKIEESSDQDVAGLINILGGTIKIYVILEEAVVNIGDPVLSMVRTHAYSVSGKFNFGISSYVPESHRHAFNSLAINVKKQLQKDGYSVRAIESKELDLSTILSLKNDLSGKGLEIGFFGDKLGKLIAVTDAEEWGERDYGKPAGDKFSGMLPPKLARMMVNIALSISNVKYQMTNEITKSKMSNEFGICNSDFGINERPLVCDPFCGSGNILMEAMMLGCDVFGSDISEKAVGDTQANLSWLKSEFLISKSKKKSKFQIPNVEIEHADATKEELVRLIENCKPVRPAIDSEVAQARGAGGLKNDNYDNMVIVCEPFLGKPKKLKVYDNVVEREYSPIKELYLNFFRNISRLSSLNSQLPICIVFPLVELESGKQYSLFDKSVDEIREMGYTLIRGPITYGRDYQIVKRQIVLLKLT